MHIILFRGDAHVHVHQWNTTIYQIWFSIALYELLNNYFLFKQSFRWLKFEMCCNMTFLFMWCYLHWHGMIPMSSWYHKWHWIPYIVQNDLQHDFSHVMPPASMSTSCDVSDIVNGTTEFLISRSLKWGATRLFSSCNERVSNNNGSWDLNNHMRSCIFVALIELVSQVKGLTWVISLVSVLNSFNNSLF